MNFYEYRIKILRLKVLNILFCIFAATAKGAAEKETS